MAAKNLHADDANVELGDAVGESRTGARHEHKCGRDI